MLNDAVVKVVAAREVLAAARADLDAEVAALPDIDGDEAMATPKLLVLLFRAVRAKEELTAVELAQAAWRAPRLIS